jgi:hypothetical protein
MSLISHKTVEITVYLNYFLVDASIPDMNPQVLGLPDPDQLVRGTDPDPSISSKNSKKTLNSTVL